MADRQRGPEADWGRVEVGPSADELIDLPPGSSVRVRIARHTWYPPPGASDLPPDFALSMNGMIRSDGVRRFVPCDPVPAFVLRAALGGYALLAREHDLTPADRFSYGATRLLYQRGGGLREHLGRSFNRESDLYLPRVGGDGRHVLPAGLGLDPGGRGTPWTPRDVVARGREEARDRGVPNPDPAACIRLGLLAAARHNPLDPSSLDEEEALALVRLGLFDLGPVSERLAQVQADRVEERVLAAFERHIGDETEDFRKWSKESADDLVHGIATKKKGGGPVPREVVRQALLELVFRSHRYVGDCVHLQMTAFVRALSVSLTATERAVFVTLYRRQPYLGGLPFVLLYDRFAFLREAMQEIWDDPGDPVRVGVLLRMLEYFGEMAGRRRGADRSSKARGRHRNEQGGVGRAGSRDQDREPTPAPRTDRFQEIAAALRAARGTLCKCGTTQAWRAIVVGNDPTADPVVIDEWCEQCGHNETVKVTRAQIQAAGRLTDGKL